MEIEIQITHAPILEKISAPELPHGAFVEFRGVVRGEENGQKISALEYEIYSPMAENEMRRILSSLVEKFPCLAAKIIHRVGKIPVGETAIYVGIVAKHRGEAFSMLAEFMDRLKQDVPIWKKRALSIPEILKPEIIAAKKISDAKVLSLDEAISETNSRCKILPPVRVSLQESFGHILREDVFAPEDLPPSDKSTRDGFAILKKDTSEFFQIVDTIHAADWKPRQLKSGETVRVATGASLPCENLRVVMQENVERAGDKIKILRAENSDNVRLRGEEIKAGEILLRAGSRINAGVCALLAGNGFMQPLVSPHLRVCHFTTGDEIVSPETIPQPGQIRDSNSILIRTLLQNFPCDLFQKHLPENFDAAKKTISTFNFQPSTFNLVLISGGASVGEKDFTRALLEELGFEIIFDRVKLRPGAPLIFGINGNQIGFGLPGNPLSHFVCFHFAVAAAVAKMTGANAPKFLRDQLGEKLEDAFCPRETLWPAQLKFSGESCKLFPLNWKSSSDVTCLAETDALIRVPPNCDSIAKNSEVEFLPLNFNL